MAFQPGACLEGLGPYQNSFLLGFPIGGPSQ